jgi:hypothetical protein
MPPLAIKDRIMYIDTDSLYIEFIDLMVACGYNGDMSDFFVTFYNKYLGDIVQDRLHAIVNNRHGESMQKFDLEHISSDALFRKKKSYLKANTWEDGRKYEITRVKDKRRAASTRAGGVGERYTCVVDGKEIFLFYEDNNMWFMERAGA